MRRRSAISLFLHFAMMSGCSRTLLETEAYDASPAQRDAALLDKAVEMDGPPANGCDACDPSCMGSLPSSIVDACPPPPSPKDVRSDTPCVPDPYPAEAAPGTPPCRYRIPTPDGARVNLDYVNVNIRDAATGVEGRAGRIKTSNDCGWARPAWYYDPPPPSDDATTTFVRLCDEACSTAMKPGSEVKILLGCGTRWWVLL